MGVEVEPENEGPLASWANEIIANLPTLEEPPDDDEGEGEQGGDDT